MRITMHFMNTAHQPSLVFALLVFLASGCVYIPTPGPKPFKEEVVAQIVPGKTTRTDLIASLGDPTYRYLDDRLFAYYGSQLKGVVISLRFGMNFEGYYLLVEFDESGTVVAAGRVTADPAQRNLIGNLTYGYNSDDKSCIATGFCLIGEPVPGWLSGVPLFAPRKMDAVAKRFENDPMACTVYIAIPPIAHLTTPDPSHLPASFVLDDRLTALVPYDVSTGVFYRFRIDPGDHVLRQELRNPNVEPLKEQQPEEFSCKAGDARFFEAVPPRRRHLFDISFKRTFLRKLNESEGQNVMRQNRLVIAPMS